MAEVSDFAVNGREKSLHLCDCLDTTGEPIGASSIHFLLDFSYPGYVSSAESYSAVYCVDERLTQALGPRQDLSTVI